MPRSRSDDLASEDELEGLARHFSRGSSSEFESGTQRIKRNRRSNEGGDEGFRPRGEQRRRPVSAPWEGGDEPGPATVSVAPPTEPVARPRPVERDHQKKEEQPTMTNAAQDQTPTPRDTVFNLARTLPRPRTENGEENPNFQPAIRELRKVWGTLPEDDRRGILSYQTQLVLKGRDPAILFALQTADFRRHLARRAVDFRDAIAAIPSTLDFERLVDLGIGRFSQRGNFQYNLSNEAGEALVRLLKEVGGDEETINTFAHRLREMARDAAEARFKREKRNAAARTAVASVETMPAEAVVSVDVPATDVSATADATTDSALPAEVKPKRVRKPKASDETPS